MTKLEHELMHAILQAESTLDQQTSQLTKLTIMAAINRAEHALAERSLGAVIKSLKELETINKQQ